MELGTGRLIGTTGSMEHDFSSGHRSLIAAPAAAESQPDHPSQKKLEPDIIGYVSQILDRLDDPVLLLAGDRTILFHNVPAQRVLNVRAGISMRSGKLVFADSIIHRWFDDLAKDSERYRVAKGSLCRAARIARRRNSKEWSAVVHSLFLRDAATSRACFIVHFVRRLNPRTLPVNALVDLFDLTRKEIAVLTRLIRRESLRDIAVNLSLSHETVRAYLKRIFRKCDVGSQAELLGLLQRISLFAKP